jgi:opacity protein-like surface antigen
MSKIFKNTTGLFNVSYMRYSSELENTLVDPLFTSAFYREFDSDVFQVTAGFSRNITELYSVYMTGGVSYTDTTESRRIVRTGLVTGETPLPDQEDDNFGGVLAAGVNYAGLYYNIRLGVSHDVRADSGTTGVVERTALTLGVDRRVSENFSLTLAASGFLNRNERNTLSGQDLLTLNIQPGFRYRITDTLDLSGAYRYTQVDDRHIDQTRERSLVYLEIRKEFDL